MRLVTWSMLAAAAALLHILGAVRALTTDYCLLSCDGVNHTMCDYPPGGGPECADFQSGLTDEEERMILDLHNSLRLRVAKGAESQKQPQASDMLQVIWDKEAAIIAQRWADQCELLGHDRCRRTLHEAHVGQNIAWMKGVDFPGRTKSRADVIEYFISGWFREVDNLHGDVDAFDPTDHELPRCGHYTQLVWANTGEIGCGFTQWETDIEYEYKLVCNYVPGGNVRGERVYRRGEACSACPTATRCSSRWPGLCEADDWSLHGDLVRDHDKSVHDHDKSVHDHDKSARDHDKSVHDHDKSVHDHDKNVHDHDKSVNDDDQTKGHSHALRSFVFMTVFSVFLNCYLSKIATVN